MSHLIFSICQNLEEVGRDANEGIYESQSKQAERGQAFASYVLYIGYHHNVWPKLKVDFLTSEDLN